jgi:hypothetical protein
MQPLQKRKGPLKYARTNLLVAVILFVLIVLTQVQFYHQSNQESERDLEHIKHFIQETNLNTRYSDDIELPQIQFKLNTQEINNELASNEKLIQQLKEQNAKLLRNDDTLLLGRMYLISVISAEFDGDLLPFFLSYYHDYFGIRKENFRIVINCKKPRDKDPNCDATLKMLEYRNIKPHEIWVGDFESLTKRDKCNYMVAKTIPQRDAFVLHVDCDEFQIYPKEFLNNPKYMGLTIADTIANTLNDIDADYLEGRLVDKLPRDCSVMQTLPNPSLYTTGNTSLFHYKELFGRFPCSAGVAGELHGGEPKKIMIYRSYLRTKYGGHHWIDDTNKRHNLYNDLVHVQSFSVYHFKWRRTVIEKLKDRVSTFKRLDATKFHWWTESQKLLDHLEKNHNRLEVKGCPC